MGVKGLWRLLLPIGRRISIETLEGKILAIDASIWLTQFLKAVRDTETGEATAAAHLQGFFRRICRLRFHGIRPVFVFDGATPEIKKRETQLRRKRREQFAKLDDGAVQRLARKLLSENLKKQQQKKKKQQGDATNPGGAFAVGFNPGEQAPEAAGTLANEQEKETSKTPVATPGQETAESTDAMLVDLTRELQAEQQEAPDETVNDWDIAVAMAAEESDASQEAEPETEYEDFGINAWNLATNPNDKDYDICLIASLPASQRKEAIEKARRQQRLRSRKEFMPAAANPIDFSQVQLTNFLRSTNLNKSIKEMALQAAATENHGLIGEQMASDRATRVLLEREDEHGNFTSGKRPAKQQLVKQGQHKFAHQESSSEDEVDWDYEPDRKPAAQPSPAPAGQPALAPVAQPALVVAKKRRTITESDDSDEYDSEEEEIQHVARQQMNRKPTPVAQRQIVQLDAKGSNSDAEQGYGFIPQKPKGQQGAKDVIELDVDSEDSELEDGGFLRGDAAPSTKQTLALQENLDRKPTAVEANIPSDAAHAQELEDRLLAQALQEAEDAESGCDSAVATSAVQVHESINLTETRAHLSERNDLIEELVTIKADKILDSSDDEEDGVDWEDGEAGESGDAKGVDGVDWEDGEASIVRAASYPLARMSNGMPSWENTSTGFQKGTENKQAVMHSPGKQQFSTETNAALERAGADAVNLADWAGRAFKRAMKEVNGADAYTVPNASKMNSPRGQPLVVDTEIDTDDHHDDSSVQVVEVADTGTQDKAALANDAPLTRESISNDSSPKPAESESRPATRAVGSSTAQHNQPTVIAQSLIDNLQQYEEQWTTERNQRARDMDTVTDEMQEEIIQLLQIFGIPYVEAPAEAEAQCAALEALGLVDGIVTEDSDVFVFGGKTVYRNIFDDKKYAEAYLARDAETEMGLGQNQLVALAMLLGGDYTEGVKGVGIVNSMEVLESFDVSVDLKGGLEKFREWLDGFDPSEAMAMKTNVDDSDSTKEQAFHAKHRTARTGWIAPNNFPANDVVQAYTNPVVDKSKDRFSFGAPDVDKLVIFCTRHLGWRPEETKHILDPVLNKIESGYRQTRMDSFMTYEDGIKFADVRSKRLRKVLGGKTSTRAPDDPNLG